MASLMSSLLAAALSAAAPATAQKSESAVLLEKGLRAYEDGQSGEALALFQRAVAVDPADAGPYRRIAAYLAAQHDDYAAAEPFARKAIELEPDLAEAYAPLFRCLLFTRRIAEFEAESRAALARLPEEPTILFNVGMACLQGRKHLEAQRFIQAALERDPQEPLYWFSSGENLLKLQQFEEATRAFRACLKLDPARKDALWKLGNALAAQQRIEEAEAQYLAALKDGGRDAALAYAIFLYEQGRRDEAVGYFRAIVEKRPDDRIAWNYLARSYQSLRRLEQAREAIQRYRELQVEDDRREDEALLRLWKERSRRSTEPSGPTPRSRE